MKNEKLIKALRDLSEASKIIYDEWLNSDQDTYRILEDNYQGEFDADFGELSYDLSNWANCCINELEEEPSINFDKPLTISELESYGFRIWQFDSGLYNCYVNNGPERIWECKAQSTITIRKKATIFLKKNYNKLKTA